MPELTRSSQESLPNPGPFLAKIVSHLDTEYMGTLEVELLHPVGNSDSREGQVFQVKYLSPFYGVTSADFLGKDSDNDTYDETQKSYGWWMIPPDIGTTVMVIFANGDPKKGFWIGCVQDRYMNFMVPGMASTSYSKDGKKPTVPVAEYNKDINEAVQDPTKIKKPVHTYLQDVLETQGLLEDDIRGLTTSSARREVPSAVFGVSTPGPVDKSGKRGKVGKFEHKIAGAFVSRLGGSTLVMDDGDDKFLRKKTASEGPPEYANVEADETDGDKKIPHNELIRIRTRTGHQILLHNSEDLIYIGNARGTSWIELSSDGKIDIYAEDSISVHTAQDLNFFAERDINMQAGRNFNTKVAGEMHTHVNKDSVLIVDENQRILVKKNVESTVNENFKHTTKGNVDWKTTKNNAFTAGAYTYIKSGSQHIETASKIHMNGPSATAAVEAQVPKELKTHLLPTDTGSKGNMIMRRMPTHEPYPQHENLNPTEVKPTKTDRDVDGRYEGQSTSLSSAAPQWKKLSIVDTFRKGS
jgi:hypothetical protein